MTDDLVFVLVLLRSGGAGWLADRLGWANPVARTVDAAGSHTGMLAVLLPGAACAGVAGLRLLPAREVCG